MSINLKRKHQETTSKGKIKKLVKYDVNSMKVEKKRNRREYEKKQFGYLFGIIAILTIFWGYSGLEIPKLTFQIDYDYKVWLDENINFLSEHALHIITLIVISVWFNQEVIGNDWLRIENEYRKALKPAIKKLELTGQENPKEKKMKIVNAIYNEMITTNDWIIMFVECTDISNNPYNLIAVIKRRVREFYFAELKIQRELIKFYDTAAYEEIIDKLIKGEDVNINFIKEQNQKGEQN